MLNKIQSVLSRPNGMAGALLVGIVFLAAAVGAFWTPHDPVEINADLVLASPSAQHWFGTDEWGRDLFSRVLVGAGVSVTISLAVSCCATVVGSLIGAASGFFGGWLDRVMLAVTDALLAFPSLIMALAVVAVFSSSQDAVIMALTVAYVPSVVRIVRSTTLTLRQRDFVAASTVMGNSRLFTLWRHILPNTVGPVLVLATSLFGWSLLAESALSFLGLGVPPPAPSWGGMLSDSREFLADAPILALAPGIAISMALLGINLLGDALRDHFDPRSRNI